MAQGDETAYRAFYDAYFERLYRYLLVVTSGDEEATREALQSALVRVVRHIKVFPARPYSGAGSPSSPGAPSATRPASDGATSPSWSGSPGTAAQQAAADDPEADAKLAALLENNLGALPFDERRLLEAKYFERRSVHEIAGDLSLSEKAVDSRLVRIRQKLKAAILDGLTHE